MSERDSNPSSDDTGNTAPKSNETTDISNEAKHAYFIPVVMLIVLSVTIVSTFYSKEFNSLFTGSTPPGHVDQHASEATPHSLESTQALDNPEDMAKSSANTESTPETEASNAAASGVVEGAAADTALITADTPSSEATAGPVLNNDSNKLVSMKHEAPSDRRNHAAYPYMPPESYGIPQQHRPAYTEIMEQQRRLYEEARQKRREHMIKMREYRAEVLKRIERDRLDMYMRMQEIEQERQRRLDRQMNRMELVEKRSINHPI